MISRKRRNKTKKDQQGYLIIFIGAVFVVMFTFFYYEHAANINTRDKVTLCRDDGVVSKETVILVDSTDVFTVSQSMVIKKKIAKVLKNSEIDERFTVYILSEDENGFGKYLSVCNPGDGQDTNELVSNKRKLNKAWEEGFYLKINTAIDGVMKNNSSDKSPIMEMLKFSSIDTMMDSKALNKRIIIVSDMLHHTKEFSHYKNYKKPRDFLNSKYGLLVKPYLNNVELAIYYVNRANSNEIQNRGHILFWEKYVQASGGFISSVVSIY